jgi:hypothetical protein
LLVVPTIPAGQTSIVGQRGLTDEAVALPSVEQQLPFGIATRERDLAPVNCSFVY